MFRLDWSLGNFHPRDLCWTLQNPVTGDSQVKMLRIKYEKLENGMPAPPFTAEFCDSSGGLKFSVHGGLSVAQKRPKEVYPKGFPRLCDYGEDGKLSILQEGNFHLWYIRGFGYRIWRHQKKEIGEFHRGHLNGPGETSEVDERGKILRIKGNFCDGQLNGEGEVILWDDEMSSFVHSRYSYCKGEPKGPGACWYFNPGKLQQDDQDCFFNWERRLDCEWSTGDEDQLYSGEKRNGDCWGFGRFFSRLDGLEYFGAIENAQTVGMAVALTRNTKIPQARLVHYEQGENPSRPVSRHHPYFKLVTGSPGPTAEPIKSSDPAVEKVLPLFITGPFVKLSSACAVLGQLGICSNFISGGIYTHQVAFDCLSCESLGICLGCRKSCHKDHQVKELGRICTFCECGMRELPADDINLASSRCSSLSKIKEFLHREARQAELAARPENLSIMVKLLEGNYKSIKQREAEEEQKTSAVKGAANGKRKKPEAENKENQKKTRRNSAVEEPPLLNEEQNNDEKTQGTLRSPEPQNPQAAAEPVEAATSNHPAQLPTRLESVWPQIPTDPPPPFSVKAEFPAEPPRNFPQPAENSQRVGAAEFPSCLECLQKTQATVLFLPCAHLINCSAHSFGAAFCAPPCFGPISDRLDCHRSGENFPNCLKCSTGQRECAIAPCGHVDYCQRCAAAMQRCRSCGQKVEKIHKIAEFP